MWVGLVARYEEVKGGKGLERDWKKKKKKKVRFIFSEY